MILYGYGDRKLRTGCQGSSGSQHQRAALSACGETIAGDLEYNSDGTASRTYYERVERGDDQPPERGDVDSIATYKCIESAPGARFVLVTSRDAEGNVLEEASHTSTACRNDLKIIAPEIP